MKTLSFLVLTMLSFADTDALSNAAIIAAEIVRAGGSFVVSEPATPPAMASMSTVAVAEEHCESLFSNEHHGRISPSSYDEEDSESSDSEEDEGRRVAKSRERNREHARRTRLRKKAQLEALQSRIKGLRAEAEVLKQSLEECSLASILMGLSHNKKQDLITDALLTVGTSTTTSETCTKDADEIVELVGGNRKRFSSPDADESRLVSTQPLKLRINGKVTYIGGGRSHVNWKTGVYKDEQGVQRQLTQSQLESLRRERNRMHAKMTRDRKKCFIATVEKTIEELESKNARMKLALARAVDVHVHTTQLVTPASISPVTPECTFVKASLEAVPSLCEGWFPPPAKRTCLRSG